MILPITISAEGASFDQSQKVTCLCGHQVLVGDSLLCWITNLDAKEPGWYAACNRTCFLLSMTEGNA
jgi:hypothetical protein